METEPYNGLEIPFRRVHSNHSSAFKLTRYRWGRDDPQMGLDDRKHVTSALRTSLETITCRGGAAATFLPRVAKGSWRGFVPREIRCSGPHFAGILGANGKKGVNPLGPSCNSAPGTCRS